MDSDFEGGVEYIQYIYLSIYLSIYIYICIYICMIFYMSEFHVHLHTQVAGFEKFQW